MKPKHPVWPLGWAPSCHTSAPLTPPSGKSAGRAGASKFSFFEDASGSAQAALPPVAQRGCLGLVALGLGGQEKSSEKAVHECVDFALVNRAHPEHLRTAWIHSLMHCSSNRPILQAGAPRPRVHGNQVGARPPILGTGLSLLQSSVIQSLSPSGPPVLQNSVTHRALEEILPWWA